MNVLRQNHRLNRFLHRGFLKVGGKDSAKDFCQDAEPKL